MEDGGLGEFEEGYEYEVDGEGFSVEGEGLMALKVAD